MSHIPVGTLYYYKKILKSCLPCSQSCLYLLILFSDCISLSLRLPCFSSFIKIPKSATKSSPLTKIKLTCCNFFKVRTCPTYINTFHCILRIDYGLQPMSRKLLANSLIDGIVELQFPAFAWGESVAISPTANIWNIDLQNLLNIYLLFNVPSGSCGLISGVIFK